MFKDFIGLFHCCKKRKDSEDKNNSNDLDHSNTGKKRNSKNSRKNATMEDIMQKIDIGENVENLESQHLLGIESQNEIELIETNPSVENKIDNLCEISKEPVILIPEYKIYFQMLNIDLHIDEHLDEALFEERFIRPDEAEKINFTRRGIIKFTEELLNITDFNKFYDKNNLILYCKKSGSPVSSDFMMGKCEYKIEKTQFPKGLEIKKLVDIMYNPELRLKWDSSAKSITKKEGDDSNYIVHIHMNSPVFFISERDIVDKRVEFYHNDIYYSLSTSVNDDYMPSDPNVIRIKTFINLLMITQDENNLYLMSINQIDPKMNIPDNFINMMLPFKISTYYKSLVDFYNKNE